LLDRYSGKWHFLKAARRPRKKRDDLTAQGSDAKIVGFTFREVAFSQLPGLVERAGAHSSRADLNCNHAENREECASINSATWSNTLMCNASFLRLPAAEPHTSGAIRT
jgi:hypothetical protein